MKWIIVAGFAVAMVFLATCSGSGSGACTADDQCPEGSWCDTVIESCIPACDTKVPCLEGHFCDPNTKLCVKECPYECSGSVENGSIMCDEGCTVQCNQDYHLCEGNRCASDTDVDACGTECKTCTTTDPNAEPICENDSCSSKCKEGTRLDNGKCISCPDDDCSAFQPISTTMLDGTTLVWQACTAGYTDNDCRETTGLAAEMYWDEAAGFCGSSTWHGFTDWRLPSMEELKSILASCPTSTSQGHACIDNSDFPNTPADWFWSSSPFPDSPDYYIWVVDFRIGYPYRGDKEAYPGYVRCVRTGP